MLLKISLTPVWTSLFWHSSTVPSLTSLHVSTPSATPSSSSMNSLSSRTPPHRREVWWESGCQGTVLTHSFFNEPGVCKIWGVRRRGWVGCRERSSPYWKISWCSVLGGKGWRGEPLRVSNHRTLPHMWCQLGTILFLPTTEKKGGLFLGSVFLQTCWRRRRGRKFGFVSVFFAAVWDFLACVLFTHK